MTLNFQEFCLLWLLCSGLAHGPIWLCSPAQKFRQQKSVLFFEPQPGGVQGWVWDLLLWTLCLCGKGRALGSEITAQAPSWAQTWASLSVNGEDTSHLGERAGVGHASRQPLDLCIDCEWVFINQSMLPTLFHQSGKLPFVILHPGAVWLFDYIYVCMYFSHFWAASHAYSKPSS